MRLRFPQSPAAAVSLLASALVITFVATERIPFKYGGQIGGPGGSVPGGSAGGGGNTVYCCNAGTGQCSTAVDNCGGGITYSDLAACTSACIPLGNQSSPSGETSSVSGGGTSSAAGGGNSSSVIWCCGAGGGGGSCFQTSPAGCPGQAFNDSATCSAECLGISSVGGGSSGAASSGVAGSSARSSDGASSFASSAHSSGGASSLGSSGQSSDNSSHSIRDCDKTPTSLDRKYIEFTMGDNDGFGIGAGSHYTNYLNFTPSGNDPMDRPILTNSYQGTLNSPYFQSPNLIRAPRPFANDPPFTLAPDPRDLWAPGFNVAFGVKPSLESFMLSLDTADIDDDPDFYTPTSPTTPPPMFVPDFLGIDDYLSLNVRDHSPKEYTSNYPEAFDDTLQSGEPLDKHDIYSGTTGWTDIRLDADAAEKGLYTGAYAGGRLEFTIDDARTGVTDPQKAEVYAVNQGKLGITYFDPRVCNYKKACSDGLDNDGDGKIDDADKDGCWWVNPVTAVYEYHPDDNDEFTFTPQCMDGADGIPNNDLEDTLADYGACADPGCSSPYDNEEIDPPFSASSANPYCQGSSSSALRYCCVSDYGSGKICTSNPFLFYLCRNGPYYPTNTCGGICPPQSGSSKSGSAGSNASAASSQVSSHTSSRVSSAAASSVPPICGNGHREGTEDCDDGNTNAGDCCSATCNIENGCYCELEGGTQNGSSAGVTSAGSSASAQSSGASQAGAQSSQSGAQGSSTPGEPPNRCYLHTTYYPLPFALSDDKNFLTFRGAGIPSMNEWQMVANLATGETRYVSDAISPLTNFWPEGQSNDVKTLLSNNLSNVSGSENEVYTYDWNNDLLTPHLITSEVSGRPVTNAVDARYIAYLSSTHDLKVYDRTMGTTRVIVNIPSNAVIYHISPTGTYLYYFETSFPMSVQPTVLNLQTNQSVICQFCGGGDLISTNGRYFATYDSSNIYDRQTGNNPTITFGGHNLQIMDMSDDARYFVVKYVHQETGQQYNAYLTDVYVYDRIVNSYKLLVPNLRPYPRAAINGVGTAVAVFNPYNGMLQLYDVTSGALYDTKPLKCTR